MNYAFVKHMNEEKVLELISYLNGAIATGMNKGFCKKMIPVWKIGKRRAMERLSEIKRQAVNN